uniref:Uncharacterized protein n=1 Tax=Pavo cristatus TaxID=9049 RepID=A0A8C9G172_PAVCR
MSSRWALGARWLRGRYERFLQRSFPRLYVILEVFSSLDSLILWAPVGQKVGKPQAGCEGNCLLLVHPWMQLHQPRPTLPSLSPTLSLLFPHSCGLRTPENTCGATLSCLPAKGTATLQHISPQLHVGHHTVPTQPKSSAPLLEKDCPFHSLSWERPPSDFGSSSKWLRKERCPAPCTAYLGT